MNKTKILLSGLFYPFAMLSYFRRALERRPDVELLTVGSFTGQYIPWNGGMDIPLKYLNQVDYPLPSNMLHPSWEQVSSMLPWKPDLSLTVDAGWWYSSKPQCLSAHVATDPHVLNYDKQRTLTDYFFNMQPSYMQTGDILLPYAFDPTCHYPELLIEEEYDCCMVGLHYPQRDEWVRRLTASGITVNYRIGDIYDEYRQENNKATIGLIWSSAQDVIARVFEVMAMGLVPVMNRLPGLDYLGFQEGKHYLGFSSMEEAVAQVQWALGNKEHAQQISANAMNFVNERQMTWDSRLEQILHDTHIL